MTRPRRCLRCNLELIRIHECVIKGVRYTEWECPGCGKQTRTWLTLREKGEKDGS